MRRSICSVFISVLIVFHAVNSQTPFNKGVNLTNWFQTSGPGQIQFTKFTKQDFENIKSLGCDVIRLPIHLHAMTEGEPEYTLDPLFLSFLDSAVTWAEELEMHLILDNHTFDPSVDTDPAIEDALIKVWTQMAEHYKNRSNYIYYEILNEPHGISDEVWGEIQQHVIDVIREEDTVHTIIVGPASWNSYNNLDNMPEYDDDNLIYTFHFYDPFLFTHQGANWNNPSMEPLSGMPFPYHPDSMPAFPSELEGTWIEDNYNDYHNDGTAERVKERIDIAVQFQSNRNVPVFCGELGVYIPNSPKQDRVNWYDTVISYLDENNIAWTMWDYTGGFGLFEEGGNDMFEHDIDTALLKAMGFNVPPQTDFELEPDSAGFPIYRDYIEPKIVESGYAREGIISFYSETQPDNGNYCIHFTGGDQYATIGLQFKPVRDFTWLAENHFALDLMIRGDTPAAGLDIRFVDTKTTDTADHPWRMRYTIDESVVEWDRRWYHLYLPLSDFTEHGSWDNETWFEPIGAFDWSAVDRFEIVAEYHDLADVQFWFDNIHITNMDTARVNDTAMLEVGIPGTLYNKAPSLFTEQNPVTDNAVIHYTVNGSDHIFIGIYNTSGQLVRELVNTSQPSGDYTVTWNGSDALNRELRNGIYVCRMITPGNSDAVKLILLK